MPSVFNYSWKHLSLLTSIFIIGPLLFLLSQFFLFDTGIWRHLFDHLLLELIGNTLSLIFGVGLLSTAIGVSLAWILARYRFFGARFFKWAAVLPLSMPAYVLAFVLIGLLDYSSPLATFFRETLDWQIPEVRSYAGLVVSLSLSLFPYIYLTSYNAFISQGRTYEEVGRSLGIGRWKRMTRVTLPMASPWIMASLALVLMETISDFGAVSVFNYDTFTTAIYKLWHGFFSFNSAAQLSVMLISVVFILLMLENRYREQVKFNSHGETSYTGLRLKKPGILGRILMPCYCSGIVLIGFIIPFIQILIWAEAGLTEQVSHWGELFNSLTLAIMVGLCVVSLSFLLVAGRRFDRSSFNRNLLKISMLGYAVPGPVLAVGAFTSILLLQEYLLGWDVLALTSGSVVLLLIVLIVKFLAVSYQNISSESDEIDRSLDEVAQNMGASQWKILRRIHAPLLSKSLMVGFLLVMIDTMKEMPITLMMRPFGWDTLSVRIYELTSEGEWERAALPSVMIVLLGLIPLIFLSKHIADQGRQRH